MILSYHILSIVIDQFIETEKDISFLIVEFVSLLLARTLEDVEVVQNE